MEYLITTPAQLGLILQGCRKQKGLTQAELARRVGLLQKYVSHAETSPEKQSVERIFRLLSGLGLELVLRDKPPLTEEDW